RFEPDPQAVRLVLRRLREGHGVGLYIEGERSWGGRPQAPRRGTVRLILRAGVPVVPAAIAGSYEAWPRWTGDSGVRTSRSSSASRSSGRPWSTDRNVKPWWWTLLRPT